MPLGTALAPVAGLASPPVVAALIATNAVTVGWPILATAWGAIKCRIGAASFVAVQVGGALNVVNKHCYVSGSFAGVLSPRGQV